VDWASSGGRVVLDVLLGLAIDAGGNVVGTSDEDEPLVEGPNSQ
jgi:hypothetical protein